MPIEIDDHTVKIRSPFFKRDVNIEKGPSSCDIFTRHSKDCQFIPSHHNNGWGIPFEAAVKIENKWIQVGPHSQKNILWHNKISEFYVVKGEPGTGKFGPTVRLVCRPAAHFRYNLEVNVLYEISEKLPFIKKSVSVKNLSGKTITIQNICIELLYEVRISKEIHVIHDYRENVTGSDRHFKGYYDYQFPEDIDITLESGEEIHSFNVFEVFTPGDQAGQSVCIGRVLKEIAPWAVKQEIAFQAFNVPSSNGTGGFYDLIDKCADAGFEKFLFFVDQIWTNIGDYKIRRDLFPNGLSDLKKLIDYIHSRKMKAGIYCSYSIAWHDSEICKRHPEWECVDTDGTKFDPAALGNMCFLSEWGNYISEKIMWLTDCLEFDEINIDGPTSIPCYSSGHAHSSIGNYQYQNWLWEKALFAKLKEKGKNITIPRGINYILMGANKIPGGYTEEDFCHSNGIQLVNNYRTRMFYSRNQSPAWAVWGFAALGNYHGNSIAMSEKDVHILDHALGSVFGYGNGGALSGANLYCGKETREILLKWVSFFKKYREVLSGDFLPISHPDGIHPDAVLYACADSIIPALCLIFNPTPEEKDINLIFPLHHAGFSPNKTASLNEREILNLDSHSQGIATVKLNPYEIRVMEITQEKT